MSSWYELRKPLQSEYSLFQHLHNLISCCTPTRVQLENGTTRASIVWSAEKFIKWWGAGFQVEKPSSSTNTWTYLFTITLCAPPQALHVLLQSPDNPAQGNLITVLTEILSCTPDAPQGNLGCVVCFLLQVSSAQSSVGHCQCCSLFVLCFNPTNPVFSWMY